MSKKDIDPSALVIDGGTQNRLKIHDDAVDEYYEILQEAKGIWPFPPLDVFYDGSSYFVADGFHRFLAANRAKWKTIPCIVHKGTAHDARIFGMTANDRNGVRMTRADKRGCVVWLLENGGKMTRAEISAKAGVCIATVKAVVAERNPESVRGKASPPKREGKGQNNPSTPISVEYQQRAMKKAPDGKERGVQCPNCARYGRSVDWWWHGACGLCLEPAEGEDAESEWVPSELDEPEEEEEPVAEETGLTVFQAQGCFKQWQETIRHMMSDRVGIDAFREAFPGPLGDRTIDSAKGLFEALGAWRKGIK